MRVSDDMPHEMTEAALAHAYDEMAIIAEAKACKLSKSHHQKNQCLSQMSNDARQMPMFWRVWEMRP